MDQIILDTTRQFLFLKQPGSGKRELFVTFDPDLDEIGYTSLKLAAESKIVESERCNTTGAVIDEALEWLNGGRQRNQFVFKNQESGV